MTGDIQSAGGGNGWWRFIYQRTDMIPAPPPQTYNVTFESKYCFNNSCLMVCTLEEDF